MGYGAGMVGVPGYGMPAAAESSSPVLLVSNFPPDRVGCRELFNLFGNYGFIVRIKILSNKPNVAMVQFKDGKQAALAMSNLKNTRLFGTTLEVISSKHPTISPTSPASLPPEHRDKVLECETTGLNRCGPEGILVQPGDVGALWGREPRGVSKSACPPTDVLHVGNLAAQTSEDGVCMFLSQIRRVVGSRRITTTLKHMVLVQFESVEAAVEVMCMLHNSALDGNHVRLSFTRNKI
jgi:hypothetical protein